MHEAASTATTRHRTNVQHAAVGLCIVLLGLFLVLDRLGIVGAQHTLRYWPVGLILIGLGVIVQASRDGTAARSSAPWGAIIWLVVLGFGLTHGFERRGTAADTRSTATMALFTVLGGTSRTAEPDFKTADVTTLMGGVRLDLRTARPAPGDELIIEVFTLMGGSVIYAPVEWVVDVQAVSVMGGIVDERRRQRERSRDGESRPEGMPSDTGTPDTPPVEQRLAPAIESPVESLEPVDDRPQETPARLVIRGFVGMGGLTIKSRS